MLVKPGTLRFLGHITVLDWGVPPDLRDASAILKIGQGPRQGGDVAASPPIPRAGCVSVTRQGSVPRTMRMWDRLSTRLPCHSLLIILLKSRTRIIMPHLGCRVSVRGRGAGWLIWCLHSHPTGSYCAESPDLLYRTGFYIKLT